MLWLWRQRRRWSLRLQMAVACACLAIGLSLPLASIVGYRAQQQVEAEVGRFLTMMADRLADKLDAFMWARSREIAMLGDFIPAEALDDHAALRPMVDRFKARFPSVSWLGLLDAQGVVLAATDGILEGINISHRPVYQNGRDRLNVADVHDAVMLAKLLPNPSGEPMKFVDVSLPILGKAGELGGVLAAHLSWAWAQEVERSALAPLADRETVQIFIVARDGTVLLGPKGMQGSVLELDSLRSAQSGLQGWVVETWPDGQGYVTGYSAADGYQDYPGLGWSVLIRKPLDVAYASADALREEIRLWGLGFALAFSVLGWLLAQRITRPLKLISKAAARLRRGEPDATIPLIAGNSEVETLSSSLRELIDSLTRSRSALVQMEDVAHKDRLTGLANRHFFDRYQQDVAERVRRDGGALTVLCIDLDGFKPVNDRLGHAAGDRVLQETALRMAACLREGDLLARLGGDEFVVVLEHDEHGHYIAEIAERLIKAVSEEIAVDGHVVRIGCSIGIASFPEDAPSLDGVLQLADEALYAAKRSGRNRAVQYGRTAAT